MHMTELKTKLENMRSKLSEYYLDPEFRGSKKMYDIERRTTRFYCGLLNLILGKNLILTDPLDDRFSFLDLIDLPGETAVVITPCATPTKRKRTLSRFEAAELEYQINRLIFLSTETDQEPESTQDVGNSMVEFWSFNHLVRQAKDVSAESQRFLTRYLNDWIQNDPPIYTLEGLPAPCDHFVPGSRDNELAKLMEALKYREPVFVTGVGGIGKTQTVIQLALRAAPRRGAYLIRFKEPENEERDLLRATILNANFLGYRFMGEDNDGKDLEYCERMDILRTQYAGAMLVLDNLDYKSKCLDDICSGPTYQQLVSMDLQLVITSRSKADDHRNIPIGPLDEKDCLTLMRLTMGDEEYAEHDEEDLCKLIRHVGRHTLMVFLMGKMLADGWWTGVTPAKILDAWETENFEALKSLPEVVTDKDQTYAEETICNHLRILLGLSSLTDADRTLMRFMSLLPGNGISERLFICGLSGTQKETLKSLIDRGMIQRENNLTDRNKETSRLKLHPIIRITCRDELKPTGDNCRKFLQRMRAQNDPDVIIVKEDIEQLAKLFSEVSDQEDPDGRWARVAGRYWTEHGDDKKALEYNQRAVDRSSNITDQRHVVTAYNQLANAYYNQGDWDKSMESLRVALEYQEQIPANESQLACTYTTLGNLYERQRDYREALQYHIEALMFARKALENERKEVVRDKFTVNLARYYTNVGLSSYRLRNDEMSLENLEKALAILKKYLPEEHPDIAQIYNHIGMVYDRQGQHKNALKYRRAALDILVKTLPGDHPDLARAYSSMGNNLCNLKDYAQALEYQLRGLEIREKAMTEDELGLAVSYANISATYRALNDHISALEYQMKVRAIREKLLPKDDVRIGYCYRNMAISYGVLGDRKSELECMECAYEILRQHPEENTQELEKAIVARHACMVQTNQV